MSKKQRDSLYAEVQKHQKNQECLNQGLSLSSEDVAGGEIKGDRHGKLSRSYCSGGSSSTLSDLDDIAALPKLFDLPLTPQEAHEYCSLELQEDHGGSTGNTSNSSSPSSSSPISSNQNSPQQNLLDVTDANGIKHEYQMLSHTHALLAHTHATLLETLPDDCTLMDIGKKSITIAITNITKQSFPVSSKHVVCSGLVFISVPVLFQSVSPRVWSSPTWRRVSTALTT